MRIRSTDLVICFSKRLRRKPSAHPSRRAANTLPTDKRKTILTGVGVTPGAGEVIRGRQRENSIKHIKLFNPVRMSRELVTTPSESYSLRTRRVAAGAVAMARTAKQMATGRLCIKKKSAQKTSKKVMAVSQKEIVRTVFPIFLKRSC
jgi:hypothetical protein